MVHVADIIMTNDITSTLLKVNRHWQISDSTEVMGVLNNINSTIWGSHGGESKDGYFLGCSAV